MRRSAGPRSWSRPTPWPPSALAGRPAWSGRTPPSPTAACTRATIRKSSACRSRRSDRCLLFRARRALREFEAASAETSTQPVFLEPADERAAVQSQRPRRLRLIAVSCGQCAYEPFALRAVPFRPFAFDAKRGRELTCLVRLVHRFLDFRRKLGLRNGRALDNHHRSLDHVFKLTDVARPGIRFQVRHGLVVDTQSLLAAALAALLEEV